MKTVGLAMIVLLGYSVLPLLNARGADGGGLVAYRLVSAFPLQPWYLVWRGSDYRSVVAWATPFRPYLLRPHRESVGLLRAAVICVPSKLRQLQAKFDNVRIDGLAYLVAWIIDPGRKSTEKLHSMHAQSVDKPCGS